jgi:hypothetical protein
MHTRSHEAQFFLTMFAIRSMMNCERILSIRGGGALGVNRFRFRSNKGSKESTYVLVCRLFLAAQIQAIQSVIANDVHLRQIYPIRSNLKNTCKSVK